MGKRRLLRLVGICLTSMLLVSVLLPASPALAAARITLDPDEGRISDKVKVTGIDFIPSDPVTPVYSYVDVYFTALTTTGAAPTTTSDIDDEVKTYELLDDKVRVDDDGEFALTFNVPDRLRDGTADADVRGGTYYVCVTYWGKDRIRAVAQFNIAAGEITGFKPDSGPVGTEVDIAGKDFAERERISIKFDDKSVNIASGDKETDSRGRFELSIVIPASTAGDHTVTISDESLTDVEETFTVKPSFTVSPSSSAPPGNTVEVKGTGFGDRKDVEITLNGASVGSKASDRIGSFALNFTVPEMSQGTYKLLADDGTNDFETEFVVEIGTQLTTSPETSAASPGYVGQSVTVSGVAFKPSAKVTITYASEPQMVGTTQTDVNGDFSYSFKIPKSQAGTHTISASDGTNSMQVPFYMESKPPPIPQPLLPEIGMRAKALTEFDWGEVTDDSGVTYTLQVATSNTFTAGSIVVEKKGLTQSGYILAKEESLKSCSAKEPYYWRVRAVDGTGNEGDWTGGNDFWVGRSLPPWTVHLFWGLGVVGAVFFGYFLGKRRGYY